MKTIGVNGIKNDGSQTTDLLLAQLWAKGHEVYDFNYKTVYAVTARYRCIQKKNALKLIKEYQPGDAIIAHSYGALIVRYAMRLGAQFGKVFLFAPAMDKDFEFPNWGYKTMYVIHNPNDKAIGLGKLLPWHDFGAMGQVGYQGKHAPRIINCQNDQVNNIDAMDHSHYFSKKNLDTWVDFVDLRIRNF